MQRKVTPKAKAFRFATATAAVLIGFVALSVGISYAEMESPWNAKTEVPPKGETAVYVDGGVKETNESVVGGFAYMQAGTPNKDEKIDNAEPDAKGYYGSSVCALEAVMSLKELWSGSSLVAVVTYLNDSDPILIEPADGGFPMVHTDRNFRIEEVIYDAQPSDSHVKGGNLTIRTLGGDRGRFSVTTDTYDALKLGDTYLVFLNCVSDGTWYNTDPDQLYFYGRQGIWSCVSPELFRSWDGEETVTIDELMKMNDTMPHEVDDGLENGIDTSEKIDFAHVMTEDEIRAFEDARGRSTSSVCP